MPNPIAIVGLCLLFAAACAPNQSQVPGRVAESTFGPAPDSGRSLSDRLRIGDLTVELEVTRLKDVQKLLGGMVHDSGDASSARAWVCYEAVGAHGAEGVVLESTEMGAGEIVMGYKVFRPMTMDADTGCARLTLPANLVQPDNGLYLGMARSTLEARLGRGVQIGDTLRFESAGRVMGRAQSGKAEMWDLTRTVDVRLRNDSVTWLQSWKLTSN